MHREILGLALGDPREGDHEDGNGLNNQDWNLRIVDDLEQQWNKAIYACNKTGFKGVRFTRNAYEANINRDGKTVYLGRRKTPEEAFELYKTAALNLHGQYARFN